MKLTNQIGDITIVDWKSSSYGYVNKPLRQAVPVGSVCLLLDFQSILISFAVSYYANTIQIDYDDYGDDDDLPI